MPVKKVVVQIEEMPRPPRFQYDYTPRKPFLFQFAGYHEPLAEHYKEVSDILKAHSKMCLTMPELLSYKSILNN